MNRIAHPTAADRVRDDFGNPPIRDVDVDDDEFLAETSHFGDDDTLRWFQIVGWHDNKGTAQPGETLRLTFGALRRCADAYDGRKP